MFLRQIRTAEARGNGELLLACDLDRGDGSHLIVSFRPSGEVEQWHILRADVAEAAARLYASHPRLESLGRGTKISLWQILARAFKQSRPSNHPACFTRFWERLKVTGAQAQITLTQDGSVQRPSGVFLPRGPLTSHQAKTLLEIGGRLVAEELWPFQTAINQLGAPILTFDRLVALLEQAMAQQVLGELQVEADRLETF